ncbi:MAG: hypothetical protein GX102_11490 [Porphyromonadaceae bacterium]|nr:hypothetical protein [Porphyromonadaceae bacterium]
MAKKNKSTKQQPFSEKRYIREKARLLPIYECRINPNWQDQGIAHIVVARRHVNGNVTYGNYLVDIFCLGVKDAYYFFNDDIDGYEDFLEIFESSEKISYELAHNIIFASIEFAEEFGFKPHPDFSLAKYILEEDTADVPLIEIECGKDGVPFYFVGPNESPARQKQIIKKLEQTAGVGNFQVVLFDEDEEEDEDDFENEKTEWIKHLNNYRGSIAELETDELVEKFKSFELEEEDSFESFIIMNIIAAEFFERQTDESIVNQCVDKISQSFDYDYAETTEWNELPDSFFGDKSVSITNAEKEKLCNILKELTLPDDEDFKSNLKAAEKYAKDLDMPIKEAVKWKAAFYKNGNIKSKKLKFKYPEFQLNKLFTSFIEEFEKLKKTAGSVTTIDKLEIIPLSHFFPDRDDLHPYEFCEYLNFFSNQLLSTVDLNVIEAYEIFLRNYINDYDLEETVYTFIIKMLEIQAMLKLSYISDFIEGKVKL